MLRQVYQPSSSHVEVVLTGPDKELRRQRGHWVQDSRGVLPARASIPVHTRLRTINLSKHGEVHIAGHKSDRDGKEKFFGHCHILWKPGIGQIDILPETLAAPRLYESEPRHLKDDNTNADRETRAIWVQLAENFKVPIRCVHFTASAKLCEHNDTVRAIAGERFNPEKRKILPHSAFSSFASRFKQPKVDEGFQDVVEVEFQVEDGV
ncbi:MAG: hypothetical protein Q9200_001731 [Gallowayella weberi]